MLLALSLLTGCSNLPLTAWGGSGERLASGNAAFSDTGDTGGESTDTGSTEADPGGPMLLSGSAYIVDDGDAGHFFITVGVAFEDAEGDIIGGTVYYDVYRNDESVSQEDRTMVDDMDADAVSEAYVDDDSSGTINFTTDQIEDDSSTYSLVVWALDSAHHRSDEIEVPVTGE